METGGHGDGQAHPEPMTFHASSMEEAKVMLAQIQAENPEHEMLPLHVKGRLVEAGVEVTIEGAGLYAVVTLNPSVQAEVTYAILAHLPEAVYSAIAEMAGAMGVDDATREEGEA